MAELTFAKTLEFISEKWSISEVNNFIDLVDDFVQKIESGIIKGKISQTTNMRFFVISKQTTLFFDVHDDIKTVELLLFWNNKENPKKLGDFLKS
ncbi:MAG: hypothetical protein AB8B52_11945 [Winogradskyella sp.]|uniref:hypothetical protein n=1 Tax=Winogradskyella sp. TaxID=1883156 RepID=UPI00385F1F7D